MMTKVLLLSESSFFRYCMSWGASGTKSWLMFVYCQPFSNILPVVLFQTLPVGRGSGGSNPRGTESTLSGTWLYIYQKCIVLQCTLKIYTTFFYLGVWDVLIGETNISHQRVCKLLCVLLHLLFELDCNWHGCDPVSISLFALQGAVQVCKEWSHSGGPKGETNRLLVARPVAVMCDFTKKLVTWYHWRLLYLLSPRALPNFHGCPLSLQNPSCPLFPLPSHPTPLPFPRPLFPLPSHPHTSPPYLTPTPFTPPSSN